MLSRQEKTLDAEQFGDSREEGTDSNLLKGNETMSSLSHPSDNFDARFVLNVGRNRVWVQPATLAKGGSVIELTDEYDSNLLLAPNEALAVAAALQSVATLVLEEESRFITRHTEPGQPAFEEAI